MSTPGPSPDFTKDLLRAACPLECDLVGPRLLDEVVHQGRLDSPSDAGRDINLAECVELLANLTALVGATYQAIDWARTKWSETNDRRSAVRSRLMETVPLRALFASHPQEAELTFLAVLREYDGAAGHNVDRD